MSYKNQLAVTLKSLGLSSRHVKVYMALLDNGVLVPATIARMTGIHRSTCYEVLNDLHKDAFITQTELNNSKAYFIETPKKIIDVIRKKKENVEFQLRLAEDAVKNIQYDLKKYKEPKVKLHTGLDGVKQIYNETLECKDKELLIYFGEEFYPEELEDFIMDEYIPNRVESGIFAKVVCHNNLLGHLDDQQLRATKPIKSSKNPPHLEVNIFDDKTQFISYANDEYTGITIEHPEIAKAMKALHGLIWDDEK